jgi:uncharacterized protein involved in high-affinity Fe2+ transport
MNNLLPYTTTATELQRNYRKVVKKAKRLKQPMIVLSKNKPEGVYIDFGTFATNYKKVGDKSKPHYSSKVDKKTGVDAIFGTWTKEEAERFNKVVDEMFEQIEPDMWR